MRHSLVHPVVLIAALLMGLPMGLATWLMGMGTTWWVDDNTCPAMGDGSPENPYCTIQGAICLASSGDEIRVLPGNYPEAIRMRPGVSVIADHPDPAMTTIDAAGQPCNDGSFCAKRSGSQCSVVTFASGHTLATRIEGFTITGGAGLLPLSPQNPQFTGGGGVYIFSSATVIDNVITNNILQGPPDDLRGAGIYVSAGAPLITGNVISNNIAVPTTSGSFATGAGIWVGPFSSPTVVGNTVINNVAGDPNVASSLGSGGGISVMPGGSMPGPVIDRNLIADNFAEFRGGGLELNQFNELGAKGIITNNTVVGNTAINDGGGVFIYLNEFDVINNTITDNTAFTGGGVFMGRGDVEVPVRLSNNIIENNHLLQFGTGGGVVTIDLDPNSDPTIEHNDLFGNESSPADPNNNQIVGDRNDGNTIGVDGNLSVDPLFADPNNRDFHLDANSPVIDEAKEAVAPPNDGDDAPRGVDGDGMPDSPEMGDVDVGAFEFDGGCLSMPEVCDGIDNDCNSLIDEGFLDTDGDSMADCVDPDDDNDLVLDPNDCAPLDDTAFADPFEVVVNDVSGVTPLDIIYEEQNVGTGTHYEVISGLAGRITPAGGLFESFCLEASTSGGFWSDARPAPPQGEAWYYLLLSANACSRGTLGTAGRDSAAGNVCLMGIVDGDADGSPSDLDCDDGDPARSPVMSEICDGVDNDCDVTVDEEIVPEPTTCGIGECASTGETTCAGGVPGDTCVPGSPSAEVCDGLDNDCNSIADDGFLDTDLDTVADCVDPDDDNDGRVDGADCAPLDDTVFGVPEEVTDVVVATGSPTSISFTEQDIGSATIYEVATGELIGPGTIPFGSGSCLTSTGASPVTDGGAAPAPGVIRYYLVKSANPCGGGSYGSVERDTLPACP